MKKFILAAAAASTLVAVPAAAAPFGGNHDRGRFEQVQQNRYGNQAFGQRNFVQRNVQVRRVETRRWRQGERFDSRYASNYRIVGNSYRGRVAPRGYRWVQSGNDAVLVALASGLIGAIIGNAF